jgi:tRNA uridine 5-carboxymethylaminomethyl modification enzyme
LLPAERALRAEKNRKLVDDWINRLETEKTRGGTFAEAVRREGRGIGLPSDFNELHPEVRAQVAYRIGYRGYIEREERHLMRLREQDQIRIPDDIDYFVVPGLRAEAAQKLASLRPRTLGQASRMDGVNPADVSVLMVRLEARKRSKERHAQCKN